MSKNIFQCLGTMAASFLLIAGAQAELIDRSGGLINGQVLDVNPPQRFNDVPPDYWAFSFIETLAAVGITAGCGNNNYCPFNAVTRAEMAVFLLRARHGGDYVPPAASGEVFVDVPSSYWGAPWIEQLAAEGITGGCGSTNYCPFRNVTRAEMAVFLLRAVHGSDYMPPPANGEEFLDVPAGFWGASWIEQLKAEGITGGCGNGNYCPFRDVTRAEMAVFLVRSFNLTYEFTKIADTAGGLFTDLSTPSINNNGTVAFRGVDGASVEGVYSAPPTAVIADETDMRFVSLGDPSISDNGFVAFDALESGGLDNGIYRGVLGENSPATLLYDTSGVFSCVLNPSVNNSGAVAFRGESAVDCGSIEDVPAGIYVGTGGAPTLIAENSSDFSEVGDEPKINDNGTVVFMADRVPGDFGVYTGDGGPFTTIVEGGSTYFSFSGPSINCAGTVAVAAIKLDGGRAIIKGDGGGATTTVVDDSSGLREIRHPSINCGEIIVFAAAAPISGNVSGPEGIYTVSNGVINKVIEVGNKLEGLTVDFILGKPSLNDNNQIVFRVLLSDDNDYIFIADEI